MPESATFPPLETHLNVNKIKINITRLLCNHPNITKSMIAAHIARLATYHGLDYTVILDAMIADGTVIKEAKLMDDSNRATVIYRLA